METIVEIFSMVILIVIMVRSVKSFDKISEKPKGRAKKKPPPPTPINSSDEDSDSDSDNDTIVFKKITKPIKAQTKPPSKRQPKPVKAIETIPYSDILNEINKLNSKFDTFKIPEPSKPIDIPKKEFPSSNTENDKMKYLQNNILKF